MNLRRTIATEGIDAPRERRPGSPAVEPAARVQLARAAAWLLAAGLLAPGANRVAADAADWPTFLGPTGDGKSAETGVVLDWPERGPPVLWTHPLGSGYAIGVVAEGCLYQPDRAGELVRLSCLDAASGRQRWVFEYPTDYADTYGYDGGPRCSPVVDEDRIYLLGVEGKLHCLRRENGELLWQVDTAQRFGVVQNFFGVGSTPVVAGKLLIAMIGGSPPESQTVPRGQLDQVRGNGSGLVAFDKHTGEVVYRITDELASYASLKLATIGDRRWCFAFARGGLVGFEPAAGAVDFQFPWRAKLLESVNASVPVVVGDQVFLSETYGPGSALLRVRPGGYDVVWADSPTNRRKAMQAHWNTPIHHEGFLYGCSGRHTADAELHCVEWATGAVRWSARGLARSSLLYVDGAFIALDEYGRLVSFRADPRRFAPISQTELKDARGESLLDYPCWAAPILAHGRLYVRGRDRLVCLDLRR